MGYRASNVMHRAVSTEREITDTHYRWTVAVLLGVCPVVVSPIRAQTAAAPKTASVAAERIATAGSTRDRVRAIEAMRSLTGAKARALLLRLLDEHRDIKVRVAVYRQLANHTHASVLQRLKKDLGSRTIANELQTITQSLLRHGQRGQTILLHSRQATVQLFCGQPLDVMAVHPAARFLGDLDGFRRLSSRGGMVCGGRFEVLAVDGGGRPPWVDEKWRRFSPGIGAMAFDEKRWGVPPLYDRRPATEEVR